MINDDILSIGFYSSTLAIITNNDIQITTYYKINSTDYSIIFTNIAKTATVELNGNLLSLTDNINMKVTNRMTLDSTQITNIVNAVTPKAQTLANNAISAFVTNYI